MEIWKRFPREEAELHKSKAITASWGGLPGVLGVAMSACASCPGNVPLAHLGFRSLG